MPGTDLLGEFEHLVLLGILRNGEQAYALPVRQTVEQVTERSISRGALYRTLDRMETKGLVAWSLEPPTEARGGHARKRYVVTADGLQALRRTRTVMDRAVVGLEGILAEGS